MLRISAINLATVEDPTHAYLRLSNIARFRDTSLVMGRGEPELNLREKADYDGKNIVHAVCWGTCPQKALRCSRGILPFSHKIRGCFEKFTLPLRSRAHLVDYGNHAHPMATTPISTTPPGPCSWTPSGRPGDGGDPSGRSRQCVGPTRGGHGCLPASR